MIDVVAKVVFLVSTALFAYHHFGYPLALKWLAARARRRRLAATGGHAKEARPVAELPTVTVIVPAYNEVAVIAEKVRNLAALAYPRDKLSIVIALDGCTDGTAAVAREALAEAGDPAHIVLRDVARNRGKVSVLNGEIGRAASDIVALSDASAMVAADALLRGADQFRASDVGVVCANYRLASPAGDGEAKYWDYQVRIKADEAELAAPMGAHGAFYMFRRACWTPLAANTINDDFVLPIRIVAHGSWLSGDL